MQRLVKIREITCSIDINEIDVLEVGQKFGEVSNAEVGSLCVIMSGLLVVKAGCKDNVNESKADADLTGFIGGEETGWKIAIERCEGFLQLKERRDNAGFALQGRLENHPELVEQKTCADAEILLRLVGLQPLFMEVELTDGGGPKAMYRENG